MAPRIEILGIHRVEAAEPCHLIELVVRNSGGRFDIGSFTQEIPDQPQDNWQVPWDEVFLDSAGESVVSSRFSTRDVRIAFFFHYLDHQRPLITPFGNVDVPDENATTGQAGVSKL